MSFKGDIFYPLLFAIVLVYSIIFGIGLFGLSWEQFRKKKRFLSLQILLMALAIAVGFFYVNRYLFFCWMERKTQLWLGLAIIIIIVVAKAILFWKSHITLKKEEELAKKNR